MFGNFWHKKEKPMVSLQGFGGGAAGPIFAGSAGMDPCGFGLWAWPKANAGAGALTGGAARARQFLLVNNP